MEIDINLSNPIARQFGFDKYDKIMKWIREDGHDLSADVEGFQKEFNNYYRVRRDEEWRKEYYDYFESIKKKTDVDFDTIIDELHKRTAGRVEASFSSKMLASIRPEMPILDSQVLKNLSLEIKGSGEKKLKNAKEVYQVIVDRYEAFKKTANCEKAITIFNVLFPNYKDFQQTKKIDFFLWAMNTEELCNMEIFQELLGK